MYGKIIGIRKRLSRHSYGICPSTRTLVKGGNNGGPVEVYGVEANMEAFGRIMTKDPDMAAIFRKYIRNVLKEARKKLTQDAKNLHEKRPAQGSEGRALFSLKSLFGGNVNILAKKRGTAGAKYELKRQRKIDQNPKMRGGNRRKKD